MQINKVYAVYFSPTGNAGKITNAIAGTIASKPGAPLKKDDLTLPHIRRGVRSYSPGDLVVFGIPVYAGRIPNKLLPAVQTLFEGNGALAIPVVTFGNRSFDNALIELRIELEQHGFHTVAGGAFVSLTVLCTLYSRSFETGFLLLKPAAPIICSFAAAFDVLTAMFGSYIVAVKTKCIEHHGIKHFI